MEHISDQLREKIARLVKENKMVEAVKLVKDEMNWGLKKSRDFVDKLRKTEN